MFMNSIAFVAAALFWIAVLLWVVVICSVLLTKRVDQLYVDPADLNPVELAMPLPVLSLSKKAKKSSTVVGEDEFFESDNEEEQGYDSVVFTGPPRSPMALSSPLSSHTRPPSTPVQHGRLLPSPVAARR